MNVTPSEHEEQSQVIAWFDAKFRSLRGRLAAVPNASKCPVYVGKKMNKEGRRKGYPDLQLLYPSNGYHGLIIEMKRASGGSLSPEQKDFIAWFNKNGYRAVVCKGFKEAEKVITEYLGGQGVKLKTARQAWYDAYYNGKENAITEVLQLGAFIQKSNINNSTDAAIHAWLAGKVQHAISTLPNSLRCFGNYLYKPEYTIDELEEAHLSIKLAFLLRFNEFTFTDAKLEKFHYIVFASMEDYKRLVWGYQRRFKSYSQLCQWIYDEYGVKIDQTNWHRDWNNLYEKLLDICGDFDKRALTPVSTMIKSFNENAKKTKEVDNDATFCYVLP